MKNKMKGFIAGIIIMCFLMQYTPVIAAGITKTVKIVLNGFSVKIDGKTLSGDKITYNNGIYVNLKEVAKLTGKDYKVDKYGNVSLNSKTVPTPTSSPIPTTAPTPMPQEVSFNTYNLRSDANFDVEVEKGIDWVPANALGKSDLNNSEIADLTQKSPEEKQKKITNLYEALQLFQISGFRYTGDNVRIREGNIYWEHHKPGFDAVRTNEGCCAADASWLTYILKDDYDELGYIGFSFENGSGHVFNYIKEGDYYYVIDLEQYETIDKNKHYTAPETGNLDDLWRNGSFSGNIIKVKALSDYVNYCVRMWNQNSPGLFVTYVADNVLPLDSVKNGNNMEITYPKDSNVSILYDNPKDKMSLKFADPPLKSNDWSLLPDGYIIPILSF